MALSQSQIEILIQARDQASAALQSLAKSIDAVRGSATDAAKAQDSSSSASSNWTEQARQLGAAALGAVGPVGQMVAGVLAGESAYGIISEAIKETIQFVGESVDAARKEEESRLQLASALQLQGRSVEDILPQLDALADHTAETTTFTKQATLDAIEYFTTVGQLGPQQTELAVKAATELASTMGVDLATAAEYVLKFIEGNTTQLQRLGLQLDASIPATQGVSAGLEYLSQRLAGTAEAAAKAQAAPSGLSKAWDEFKVSYGESAEPVVDMLDTLATKFLSFGEMATDAIIRPTDSNTKFAKATETSVEWVESLVASAASLVNISIRQSDIQAGVTVAMLAQANAAAATTTNTEDLVLASEDLAQIQARLATAWGTSKYQLVTSTEDQGEALTKLIAGLISTGHSTDDVSARIGSMADQFVRSARLILDGGIGQISDGQRKILQDQLNVAEGYSTSNLKVRQTEIETAGIIKQTADIGLAAKLDAINTAEQKELEANKSSNLSYSETQQLNAAAAAKYAAQRTQAITDAQRQLDNTVYSLQQTAEREWIASSMSGTDARLANLNLEEQATIRAVQLMYGNAAIPIGVFTQIAEAYSKRRTADFNNENLEMVKAADAAAADLSKTTISTYETGLSAQLDTLRAEQDADEAAARLKKLNAQQLQQELTNIQNKYTAQRTKAIIDNMRATAQQEFEISQDTARAEDDLKTTGLQHDLEINALELADKQRSLAVDLQITQQTLASKLVMVEYYTSVGDAIRRADAQAAADDAQRQIAADQELLGRLASLYAIKSQQIIANYDPMRQAWLHLNDDMRQDWADTWDQALTSESGFLMAMLRPFYDFGNALLKILSGYIADIEQSLLAPLFRDLLQVSGLASGGGVSGAGVAGLAGMLGGGTSALNAYNQQAISTWMAGGNVNAISSGVNLSKGIGAGSTMAGLSMLFSGGNSTVGGAMTGFGIGMMTPFGPLGGLAGAGIGALAGWIGSLFGGNATKDAREQFAQQLGYSTSIGPDGQTIGAASSLYADLQKQAAGTPYAAQAQALVNQALTQIGKGDTEANQAWMGQVQQLLTSLKQLQSDAQTFGLTWKDMTAPGQATGLETQAQQLLGTLNELEGAGYRDDAVVRRMAGSFNQLLSDAIDAGQKIPPSMEPILDQLAKMGLITDDNAAKLLGLSTGATVDFQSMETIANTYGIALSSLGEKFEQSKLSALASQYLSDFNTLKNDGADVNGVLDGMQDEFSALVQESIQYGTTLPAELQPVLQMLVDQGKLVDANGNALTDLSSIQFAAPMVDQTQKLIDAIHQLTAAITGNGGSEPGLPGAMASAVASMQDSLANADLSANVRLNGDWTNGLDDAGQNTLTLRGAANGVYADAPTLRVFAEREPELGGPVSFMSKALRGALSRVSMPSAGPSTVHVEIPMHDAAGNVTTRHAITIDLVRQTVKRTVKGMANTRELVIPTGNVRFRTAGG